MKTHIQRTRDRSGGKSDEDELPQNIEIILPFEALLPSFYIPDEQEKIGAYQKLAGAEDETILKEFESDLRDEYGPLPRQAENLLKIILLKMACRRAGVVRIKMDTVSSKQRDIVVSLAPRVTAEEIMQMLKLCPEWRISGTTLRLNEEVMKTMAGDEWVPELAKQIGALIKKKAKKKAVSELEA